MITASREPDRGRIAALDALRGVAIIMVIVGHFVPGRLFHEDALPGLAVLAGGGVMLFFLLSGFLIEQNLARDGALSTYLLRRAFRIVPAYWVSLIGLLLLDRVLTGGVSFTAQDVAATAIFAQDALRVATMNASFWTLLIETRFYLLAPLVRRCGTVLMLGLPYALMAVNTALFLHRGAVSNFLTFVTYCFVGMQFSLWYRRQIRGGALALTVFTVSLHALIFLPYYRFGMALLVLVNAGLLAAALRRGFAAPGLAFIGAISYSWYLYHAPVGYTLMAALEGPALGVPPPLSLAAGVAVTLLIAYGSYRLIERPSIRAGRSLERRWMAERVASRA